MQYCFGGQKGSWRRDCPLVKTLIQMLDVIPQPSVSKGMEVRKSGKCS